MEAGTDDQILSLSGCPVTEVYSKEMCGKQTGFLRRACTVTHMTKLLNKEFLLNPRNAPMAVL